MKSRAESSFWQQYYRLPADVRDRARKAYRLWQLNPAHPGLAFKRLNAVSATYSVRISDGYRVIGRMEGDILIWFFIGNHDDYLREISKR